MSFKKPSDLIAKIWSLAMYSQNFHTRAFSHLQPASQRERERERERGKEKQRKKEKEKVDSDADGSKM